MLIVAPVKESRRLPFDFNAGDDMRETVNKPRSDVPAITHVDYSARVQTIDRETNPVYHDLISAFERETGYAVIVNTSFNVRGEPIVLSPFDAYRCFMRTEMDVLVLENFILFKEEQPDWPEPKGHFDEYDTGPPQKFPRALTQGLESIFDSDFLPKGKKLREALELKVSTAIGEGGSRWDEHTPVPSLRDSFEIPEALDSANPDPQAMATAITAQWTPGAATEALRPIVAKLIELGREVSGSDEADEEVSDSIYVMF
jgi:carbamoyltransferase